MVQGIIYDMLMFSESHCLLFFIRVKNLPSKCFISSHWLGLGHISFDSNFTSRNIILGNHILNLDKTLYQKMFIASAFIMGKKEMKKRHLKDPIIEKQLHNYGKFICWTTVQHFHVMLGK